MIRSKESVQRWEACKSLFTATQSVFRLINKRLGAFETIHTQWWKITQILYLRKSTIPHHNNTITINASNNYNLLRLGVILGQCTGCLGGSTEGKLWNNNYLCAATVIVNMQCFNTICCGLRSARPAGCFKSSQGTFIYRAQNHNVAAEVYHSVLNLTTAILT